MVKNISDNTVQQYENVINSIIKTIYELFEVEITYEKIEIPFEQRNGYHYDYIYRYSLKDENYVNDGVTPVNLHTTYRDVSFKKPRYKDGTRACFHNCKKVDEIIFFDELNDIQELIKKDINNFCSSMKRYAFIWACAYFEFAVGILVNKIVDGLEHDKTNEFISFDDFIIEVKKNINNGKWL